jgi:hypothetical protein
MYVENLMLISGLLMLLVHSLWTSQIQLLLLLHVEQLLNNTIVDNLEPILYLELPCDPVMMTALGHQVRAWIWKLVRMVYVVHLALQIGS